MNHPIIKLDRTVLLFHLDELERHISPKKGIGSGSKISSGGHFSKLLWLSCLCESIRHHMFLQKDPQFQVHQYQLLLHLLQIVRPDP